MTSALGLGDEGLIKHFFYNYLTSFTFFHQRVVHYPVKNFLTSFVYAFQEKSFYPLPFPDPQDHPNDDKAVSEKRGGRRRTKKGKGGTWHVAW